MKEGWETKKLGEVCEMYQPKTITGKEMLEDGPYPVYGANGVIGRYHQFNHDEPQLLITCRGATCGSVNISAPQSWITGNAMVVRPKGRDIEIRFLEYLFRGGIDISKAITGAAQPQITRANLSPLEISYPASVGEQRRIVGILDEAFEGIARAKANAEKNLANARAVFESYLNAGLPSAAMGGKRDSSVHFAISSTDSLSMAQISPMTSQMESRSLSRPATSLKTDGSFSTVRTRKDLAVSLPPPFALPLAIWSL